jgi:mRNA-degrading endonuclease RelE of RelBE toxin-antitoxin system
MVPNIEWSEEARADVRRLDKPAAQRVFDTLLRFARTGQGDIRQSKGSLAGKLRLRCGDYRVMLSQSGNTLRIHSVRHRREAYR